MNINLLNLRNILTTLINSTKSLEPVLRHELNTSIKELYINTECNNKELFNKIVKLENRIQMIELQNKNGKAIYGYEYEYEYA